jgi:hypothetical protein
MHACLEIQTLTELSPIWQWVYMRTLTQRSFSPSFPVIGNTLGAPRLLTHSGYGKSWAVDLGNGSLRVYVSTCLCVYVRVYLWLQIFHDSTVKFASFSATSLSLKSLWTFNRYSNVMQTRQAPCKNSAPATCTFNTHHSQTGRRQRFFDLRHGDMALPSKSRFSMNCYEQKYELLWIGMNYSI